MRGRLGRRVEGLRERRCEIGNGLERNERIGNWGLANVGKGEIFVEVGGGNVEF
jgi:hypothetical protein